MIVKIDGTSIKDPSFWDVELYKLTKAGRVASGKMTMDTIALKRKFTLQYQSLSGKDLKTIEDLLFTMKSFFDLEYEDNGQLKSAVVYIGAIKRRRFRTGGVWYWKDVEFALIEQ